MCVAMCSSWLRALAMRLPCAAARVTGRTIISSAASCTASSWQGAITYTPRQITVELDTPAAPRVARALSLLIEEINPTPPSLPGDTRPITNRSLAQCVRRFNLSPLPS